MKPKFFLFLFATFFQLLGNSRSYGERPGKAIDFRALEQLKPGESSKEQARRLLGEPNEITDLSKSPNIKDRNDAGIIWEYFENGNIRLSVSFQPGSALVDSWTWYLYNSDPEKDAKTALSKFSGVTWQSETVKWVNPHHYPNECFFTDNAKGISIEYDRTHKNISSITEWNPSRKPASVENEKPPRFCIEDACSDGILSKELFKDAPLCPIPK